MQTVYLNMRGSQGVETVDEFTREAAQSPKEFRLYIVEMKREYRIAGMNVYQSSRCTNNWKQKDAIAVKPLNEFEQRDLIEQREYEQEMYCPKRQNY